MPDATRLSGIAERLYLAGRQSWNRRTEQGFREGLQLFEQAIREDPAYLPAYSGLADSYILLGEYGFLEPKDAYPRAKMAALQAVTKDESVPAVHTSLAFVAFAYEWDWSHAEAEYRCAIDLDPNYATAHQWYAWYLMAMRRFAEALTEIRRARELDPSSAIMHTNAGAILYFGREYDQAIMHFKEVLAIKPDFAVARGFLGNTYAQKGLYEEAILELQKAAELTAHRTRILAELGFVYARSGRTGEAEQTLEHLKGLSEIRYVSMVPRALIHAGLGHNQAALDALEGAAEERSSDLALLAVDPHLDGLRSEPRFQEVMRRIGFPV
jgi:tetratricopeptide (TPR) repeat protein